MPDSLDYDSLYRSFDSPVMRAVRAEAYGNDIGQHSWVTAHELDADARRLGLSPTSRLLDLGCGPCGPLTYVVARAGCHGTGMDVSRAALESGRARAVELQVNDRLELVEADADAPIQAADASFDAVMALDVILHLRDRRALFREVMRVLKPGGRFLFTDGGVITGALDNEEIAARAAHGHTQFVPARYDERLLEEVGFRVVEVDDRTASVMTIATARMAARIAHRAELETIEGAPGLARQLRYLETVIELSRRRAISRIMYLASR